MTELSCNLPAATGRVDRRTAVRARLTRACKIGMRGRIGYAPAATADIAAGGCRLTAFTDRPFQVGQQLLLAIPAQEGKLLRRQDLRPCQVLRVKQLAGGQELAVEFATPAAAERPQPERAAA